MSSTDHRDLFPALVLEGVSKCYPGNTDAAVRGLDLRMAPGEIVAVVGASGSGKTTLLRLVAGLEVPDSGSIRVADRPVASSSAWVPPEGRGVGLVFQGLALFPHLRVIDNVAYGLRSLPRTARRERAREMLEMVRLAALAERYPHQLSGGEQQRVAVARALAPRPALLLLDEPFSNLDLPLKVALRGELAQLLRAATVPTLLVVHDIADALELADRIVVMRAGEVIQHGAPEQLRSAPRDEYVAALFGLRPTELAHRRIEETRGLAEARAARPR